MKITMNMKNYQGFIRQYRYIALIDRKGLTDQEYRLLDVYACLVCWDSKNKDRFGTVTDLTIRDIHVEHLPAWSVGKISGVIKSLIKKGRLTRLPKKRMCVENFWIYQSKPQQAEQAFQLIEQGIQPTEQNIQLVEQNRKDELQNGIAKLVEKFTPFEKNVQPNEQTSRE
jgi:polyhydroxyalkanoate synthesis regulator phasin